MCGLTSAGAADLVVIVAVSVRRLFFVAGISERDRDTSVTSEDLCLCVGSDEAIAVTAGAMEGSATALDSLGSAFRCRGADGEVGEEDGEEEDGEEGSVAEESESDSALDSCRCGGPSRLSPWRRVFILAGL